MASVEPAWGPELVESLTSLLPDVATVKTALSAGQVAIHLSVLSKPLMDGVNNGSKTADSRWHPCWRDPFYAMRDGDVVIFKRSCGYVEGAGIALGVRHIELVNQSQVDQIQTEYQQRLALPSPHFKQVLANKRKYLTLFNIDAYVRVPNAVRCNKTCTRGWVLVRRRPL